MTAPYPWLRVYASMLSDCRVLAAAADLGRTEAEVLGYLVALMLWAGEHAQDGVLRPTMPGGEAVIIERAVHWRGRAGRLASALVEHGLLKDHAEGLALADWQEQQGAHIAKLERDRAAADAKRAAKKSARSSATPARPSQDAPETVARESRDGRAEVVRESSGKRERGEGEEKKQDNLPVALVEVPSAPKQAADQLVELWNATAPAAGLPAAQQLTPKRRDLARARLKDQPDLAVWAQAIARVAASRFCRGLVPAKEPGQKPWVATFGWLLKPDSWVRAMEGAYDDKAPPSTPALAALPPRCDCCPGLAIPGDLFGMRVCQDHATQAAAYPEGPRAWLERTRGAA